jgi:hypothetical protein
VTRTVLVVTKLFTRFLWPGAGWQVDKNQQGVQSLMGMFQMVAINTFMTSGFGLTQVVPATY